MTIIFLGLAFYVGTLFKIEERSRTAFDVKKRLVDRAREVVLLIQEDETPESNHLFDDFYLTVQEMEDVELKDISSYLNLNTIDQRMLIHLNDTLLDDPDVLFADPDYPLQGTESEAFVNFRDKYGPLPNAKISYGNYLEEESFDLFFTDYSYYNFNLTDEFVMAALYAERNGSEENSIVMRQRMANYINSLGRIDNPKLKDLKDLEFWFVSVAHLGQSAFDSMFPLLNTEPQMNIHFVPEEIIRGILSYQPYGVAAVSEYMAKEFVKRREDSEEHENGLTEQDFHSILGSVAMTKFPATKIRQYFGFITWFWEIRVVDEPYELRWIIARIPPKDDMEDKPEFKLINEHFAALQPETGEPEGGDEEGAEAETGDTESDE